MKNEAAEVMEQPKLWRDGEVMRETELTRPSWTYLETEEAEGVSRLRKMREALPVLIQALWEVWVLWWDRYISTARRQGQQQSGNRDG